MNQNKNHHKKTNLTKIKVEGDDNLKRVRSLHKFAHWLFGLFEEENSQRLGV